MTHDKWHDLARRLIKLTESGAIKWRSEVVPSSLRHGSNDFIRNFFVSEINGRTLGIFERNIPYEDQHEQVRWQNATHLGFFDEAGVLLTESPELSIVSDLLKSAQDASAGVEEFLDSLKSA